MPQFSLDIINEKKMSSIFLIRKVKVGHISSKELMEHKPPSSCRIMVCFSLCYEFFRIGNDCIYNLENVNIINSLYKIADYLENLE